MSRYLWLILLALYASMPQGERPMEVCKMRHGKVINGSCVSYDEDRGRWEKSR